MSRIEPAQGKQKLMRADVPALPVELARLKLSMLAKEVGAPTKTMYTGN